MSENRKPLGTMILNEDEIGRILGHHVADRLDLQPGDYTATTNLKLVRGHYEARVEIREGHA